MTVYNALVQDGRLPRIEDLPEEKKWELWNMAIADAAGRLRREEVKRVARVLFLLEQTLNVKHG
jgi:hypothetical protein